jgi:hypothetical protein
LEFVRGRLEKEPVVRDASPPVFWGEEGQKSLKSFSPQLLEVGLQRILRVGAEP